MAGKQFNLSVIFDVVNNATGPLRRAGQAFQRVAQQVKKATKNFGRLGIVARSVGASMKRAGTMMASRMGLALTAFGALAINTKVKFETSMNRVQAVTTITTKSMQDLREQAKQLGISTQFSASQAADAMTFLSMAGLDSQKVFDAMPSTLQLAAAGALDLATAADLSTNIMTAMNLEAKDLAKVNDILAEAASKSNTNILQLGEAFQPVAGFARAAGLSVAKLTALLGKMADAGQRGGIAGTVLRQALNMLLRGGPKMESFLAEIGSSMEEFTTKSGKLKNFDVLMKKIAKAGVAPAKIMRAFGRQGGRAILTLTAKGKDLTKFTKRLEEVSGRAKEMQEIMMKGLPGAMKELASAWEGLQLAMTEGDVGKFIESTVRDLTSALRVMAEYPVEEIFGSWGDALKGLALDWWNMLKWAMPALKLIDWIGKKISGVGEEKKFTERISKEAEEERETTALFGEFYKMSKLGVLAAAEKSETKVTIDVRGKEGAIAVLGAPIKKKGKPNVRVNTVNAGEVRGAPAIQ